MNSSQFGYSNEVNSFRAGMEDRLSQHKDKVNMVNQALGIKADKVFENAKKLSDNANKLLEAGGGALGTSFPLAKVARKGIESFKAKGQDIADEASAKMKDFLEKNKSVLDKGKGLLDKGKQMAGEIEGKVNEAGSKVQNTIEETKSSVNDAVSEGKQAVQSARDGAQNGLDPVEGGGRQALGSSAEPRGGDIQMGDMEGKVGGEEAEQAGGRLNNVFQQGEDLRTLVDGEEGASLIKGNQSNWGRFKPAWEQEGTTADAGIGKPAPGKVPQAQAEEVKSQDVDVDLPDVAKPTANLAKGDVPDLLNSAGTDAEDVGNIASKVLGNTGKVALDEAIGTGFDEAAAATSWLAWLGVPELLAGAGAIAGVVGAGVGIADAVKGGEKANTASQMPTTANLPGAQVAGTFVVPTMDSIQ